MLRVKDDRVELSVVLLNDELEKVDIIELVATVVVMTTVVVTVSPLTSTVSSLTVVVTSCWSTAVMTRVCKVSRQLRPCIIRASSRTHRRGCRRRNRDGCRRHAQAGASAGKGRSHCRVILPTDKRGTFLRRDVMCALNPDGLIGRQLGSFDLGEWGNCGHHGRNRLGACSPCSHRDRKDTGDGWNGSATSRP